MRKLIFGLFGFLALGLGILGFGVATVQPAEAQPYPGYRHHYGPPGGYYPRPGYRPYRPHYRPYYGYRPYPGYRPYRPAYVGPRCFTRNRQIWNGYRWVWRPVRVCRY